MGHAELLSAALCIPALLLYFTAADGSHHLSPLTHWLLVVSAACVVWMAALCKEIGITVIGAMVVYDILLVPLYSGPVSTRGSDTRGTGSKQGGGGIPAARARAAAAAVATRQDGQVKGRTGKSRSSTAGRSGGGADPAGGGGGSSSAGVTSSGCSVDAVEGDGEGRGSGMDWRKVVRIVLLALAGLLYLKMRGWVAVDHLVRIYRRVSNVHYAHVILNF